MTAKKNQPMQNGRAKENVLQRVLQLPVVSSTCESLQRTYSSTKEIHPIVASVCEVYEQGVKGASALAMWSVEPVVRRLEPQFSVANNLACRGLDHLEEKIPALQYPVEKLASKLKDTISTPIQSAKSTIGYSMDKILGLAVGGYETTRTTVETTARYTRSNSVSQMAAAGMDTALGGLEKLMEYLLPEEEEAGNLKPKKTCGPAKVSQQQSRIYRAPSAPSSAPSTLGRIGALVSTASHRAYQHTVQNLQRAKAKGQELVVWIPILGNLAKPSPPTVPQSHGERQSTAGSWRQSRVPEQKQEKTEKEDGHAGEAGDGLGLVGSVAHNLQSACASGISSMKKVPAVAWDAAEGLILFTPRRLSRAMETVDALGGTLISAPKHLLGSLYSYVPLRRQSKDEAAARGSKPGPEAEQKEEEESKPVGTSAEEKAQLRGDWRLYRGHHPLSFLGLEDPLFIRSNLYRSSALEPEAVPRKSAFAPYSRRVSEGSYRFSPEAMYSRAYYANLYSPAFKKE
ncbi:perilipin-1 [Tympanuchus pallidicinctus]|uniref:perilipin-1 n=1 Tax=Tympanuchus pallidicinctus TaxID=109042 RepID=UPI002286E209|nr:perilipin-1 [Tympanuchus pallidicinctus]